MHLDWRPFTARTTYGYDDEGRTQAVVQRQPNGTALWSLVRHRDEGAAANVEDAQEAAGRAFAYRRGLVVAA